MSILVVNGLAKYWGAELLFERVGFALNPGEKLALMGRNGSGKTTLLHILLGQEEYDTGTVTLAGRTRVAYLSQDPCFADRGTVLAEAHSALAHLQSMEDELRNLEAQMAVYSGGALDALVSRYGEVATRFESQGGYEARAKVLNVLFGLGFSPAELEKSAHLLSGGQKVRLGLAKVLLEEPDLLLLDEPTNHLDLAATEWLESYLKDMKSAAILVSHDRYFLDRVISRVYELEHHTGADYAGNYSYYVQEKQRRLEAQREAYERQQAEYSKLEAFYLKWRLTPSRKNQAMSRKKQLEKMDLIERPKAHQRGMKLRWQSTTRTGDDVLQAVNLAKRFGGEALFAGVDLRLYAGDKVALVGPNGVGKSTFLKVVHELLPPSEGTFRWGVGVKRGYFSQDLDDLDSNRTCLEEILKIPDFNNFDARSLLGRFLFPCDAVHKLVGTCSGGERNRLTLAKLVVSGANVLILDEPTNHLDLAAKGVLQDALQAFAGTIVFVSHDRYFIDHVASKVWEFADRRVTEYEGNYTAYKEEKARREAFRLEAQAAQARVVVEKGDVKLAEQAKPSKQERLNAKTVTAIEDKITTLEAYQAQLEERLPLHSSYKGDGGRELVTEYKRVQAELEHLYQEWEALWTAASASLGATLRDRLR